MGKMMPASGKGAMSFGLQALSFLPKEAIQIPASELDTLSKGSQFEFEKMGQFVFQGET